MCVLQDFEAITPNLLARTIETVEGGGLVVLLLKSMTSLRQLYAMSMVRSRSVSDSFWLTGRPRMFMRVTGPLRMIQLSRDSTNDSSFLWALVTIV